MALKNLSPEQVGEILVRLGVVTKEQVAEVLPEVSRGRDNLLTALAEKGYAREESLLKALSESQKVPFFASFSGLLDPAAARLIPSSMARHHLVVPLTVTKKGLLLGMVNAVDIVAIDMVSAHTKMKVYPVLTTRRNLFETIEKVYAGEAPAMPSPPPGEAMVTQMPEMPAGEFGSVRIIPREMDQTISRYNPSDSSVIDIVDGLIAEAVAKKASDIHLEPSVNALRLRLRVDGILHELRLYPKEIEPAIMARVKILSRLDITECRLPQDGHISVDYGGRGVDLRVSSLPTIHGEKMVIRVLDQGSSQRGLPAMGLPPDILATFRKIIHSPMGMVLVTGPTGSGKTTTLYAAIADLNSPDRNIVTLEDPVEYRVPGINQVETNAKIGLTFAAGLRSILRQDPNVILVGEIRDLETAEIAIQASITGHLVFSTLHTKDSVGTIARLLNMKVEPFLLSAALSGVMAQRLVRVLCEHCKRTENPDPDEIQRLGVPLQKPGPFFVPVGCDYCHGIGYTGRRGIYEWLVVNREIRRLILADASGDQIKDAARSDGIKTLQEAGLELVYQGLTSIPEVVRVTYEEEVDTASR